MIGLTSQHWSVWISNRRCHATAYTACVFLGLRPSLQDGRATRIWKHEESSKTISIYIPDAYPVYQSSKTDQAGTGDKYASKSNLIIRDSMGMNGQSGERLKKTSHMPIHWYLGLQVQVASKHVPYNRWLPPLAALRKVRSHDFSGVLPFFPLPCLPYRTRLRIDSWRPGPWDPADDLPPALRLGWIPQGRPRRSPALEAKWRECALEQAGWASSICEEAPLRKKCEK